MNIKQLNTRGWMSNYLQKTRCKLQSCIVNCHLTQLDNHLTNVLRKLVCRLLMTALYIEHWVRLTVLQVFPKRTKSILQSWKQASILEPLWGEVRIWIAYLLISLWNWIACCLWIKKCFTNIPYYTKCCILWLVINKLTRKTFLIKN